MSKRINSRDKGKRGERMFRDVLREAGYLKAYRGQQFRGGSDSPDVVVPELPEIHWEVKCRESGNPYKWLEQARNDLIENESDFNIIPVVAHKKNGMPWMAICYMDSLLEIIRRSDLPQVTKAAVPVANESYFIASDGVRMIKK